VPDMMFRSAALRVTGFLSSYFVAALIGTVSPEFGMNG
jgi:hypothetical protein